MFTGIVEETGTIERLVTGAAECFITIRADAALEGTKEGDSIAVNGVCLTVTEIRPPFFTADVMPETLRRSNLYGIPKGSRVNLERAMPLNGRFGGHIVAGHIDGTGTVLSLRREENAVWIRIAAAAELTRYIVAKGSVALDGVSLTVVEVLPGEFSVSLIPRTASETTLLEKKSGDKINIECDMIGKYVEKLMGRGSGGITEELLREYGF